jgi:hypothetical protein
MIETNGIRLRVALGRLSGILPPRCMDFEIESMRSRAMLRVGSTQNLSMVDYDLSAIDLKENKNV